MKPSWDRLMEEFKDSKSGIVADVDCTVEEELCSKHGVEGYPTIKHGTVGNLQDYNGEREYDDLLKFAKENLGPTCGPKNLDLCSEEQKKAISTAQALKDDDLKKQIKDIEDAVTKEEKSFEDAVQQLQKKYEEMSKAKDDKIAKLKKDGDISTLKMIWNDRYPAPPPAPKTDDEAPPEEGEGDEPPPEEGPEDGEKKEEGEKKDDL